MDPTENAVATAESNGNENGIKRPHDAEGDHEPGIKKVKIGSSASADPAVLEVRDEPTQATQQENTSTIKSEPQLEGSEATPASEPKPNGHKPDARDFPRGTALIKPE